MNPKLSKAAEADNVSLGQYGAAYLTDTSTYTPPEGKVVVAIQFTQNSTFDDADATVGVEDLWPDPGQGGPGTNSAAIPTADVFPAGLTIYGRWSAVALDSGAAMLYLAMAN